MQIPGLCQSEASVYKGKEDFKKVATNTALQVSELDLTLLAPQTPQPALKPTAPLALLLPEH